VFSTCFFVVLLYASAFLVLLLPQILSPNICQSNGWEN
jgi:hypothetical protein